MFVFELDLLPLEDGAVRVPEHGQQHLVFELRLERMPVDVEHVGVPRALTVFEHILPPWVRRLGDAHVIRDHVDDVAHAPITESGDPPLVGLEGADLRVQLRRIGYVIAVHAARHRLQVTRCVAMRDAECRQVVDDGSGVVEREGELN
jgi:hypothetical protein